MDQMTERNRRLAREGEPVFSLAGILAQKPEAERQELSRLAGTEDLASWLLDPKNLTMLLNALPAADFSLFCKAAEAPFLQEDQVFLPMHSGLIHFALMQPYLYGDKLYLVIPTEVRELWRDLKTTGFPEQKRRKDLLDSYAQACVKLYGAIPLDEFFSILKQRGGENRDRDAETLLFTLADGTYYTIEGDLLLHAGLDATEAAPYLEARKGLPPYLPAHDKLLRYGDGDYFDVFHDLELWRLELEDRFRESGAESPEQRAMDFVDSLYAVLRTELADETHGELFAAFDLEPEEERVRRIKDKTRLWCLYGNTPEELLSLCRSGDLRPPVNGPCPCGSGRKYKKCHGAP
jgi:hypothetical protein